MTRQMQKTWYLGFLGLIGFHQFPHAWEVLSGQSQDYWGLLSLMWFLWFLNFLPERAPTAADFGGVNHG